MDFVIDFLPFLLMIPLYGIPVWLLLRAVRALERIVDKIEIIADNENTRK